jgi:predicted transcriptional regulator
MARRDLPPLSEAQLEIVNIVWDKREATVPEVWRELAKRRPVARNTISTMIARLEEKGWLRHRVRDGIHVYSPAQPRKKVLARLVHRLVDAAFEGSAEGLVLALLEGGRLTVEEVERIKAMLDKAEQQMREAEP